MMQKTARARANIALAKYWGKSDVALNLPAVPSLSLTLEPLTTTTTVTFTADLRTDSLLINGKITTGDALARASKLLARVRERAGVPLFAHVESKNEFPTASGLASSASGFAALACAASAAAGLPFSPRELSMLARASSASAARSIYPGFVALPAGKEGDSSLQAEMLFDENHWDVCMIVAVNAEGAKAIGSTSGMERSRTTSPYYNAWLAAAPSYFNEVLAGVAARDLARVGTAMEESTFAMHACAMASSPSVSYLQPATLSALETVRRLRKTESLGVYATMDAGPHVKALCLQRDADRVERGLRETPGVLRTLRAVPGRGVEVLA
jgi:diphosphomevalonate decarboxylase